MMSLTKAFVALLLIVAGLTFLAQNALAVKSISLDSSIEDFSQNLENQLRELVTGAVNDIDSVSDSTENIVNATGANSSSVISNRVVASNNYSLSSNAGGNATSLSTQITTVNGVCSSNISGGPGNETLSSEGVCNDNLIGGAGGDTFVCGEGNDIIRDYNATEGDRLVDEANCETVL